MSNPKLQLLPQHHAKLVRKQGQSYYVDETGDRFPSVTTILNATKPQADREALQKWRQRVGIAQAQQIASRTSRRGTGIHKQIQRYLLLKAPSISEAIAPYWESLQPIIENIQQVRLVEGFVVHQNLRYGGRVDCVASYKGIPCVFDWKTADRPKGSVERLYDAPLQLAAYLGAVNHYYRDDNIKLNHALIVVALPGMPAEMFWFDPEAMNNYWQQWKQRVESFYALE